MPRRFSRPCSQPGCPNLECREHRRPRRAGRRPSAAARGYGRRWQRLRKMFLRANPLCVECGAAASEVDHIIPLRQGGSNRWDNLQALCKSCHSRKTAQER